MYASWKTLWSVQLRWNLAMKFHCECSGPNCRLRQHTGMVAGSAGRVTGGGVDSKKKLRIQNGDIYGSTGKAGGVRTRASELLRITYRSFRHYAKKHGL